MKKKRIIHFGGSNTHGYRASNDSRCDEQEHWTCLLQKQLGDDYLIIEEGLSGRITYFPDPIHEGLSGLNYIYPCLMSREPVDLLVIMLRTDDTRERLDASTTCIALGLERLIAKAASISDAWQMGKPNVLVVIPKFIDKRYVTTPAGRTMGIGCAERSECLAEEFKGIASLMGCHYLDTNAVVTKQSHYDYMHLTKEEYQELASTLSKVILSLSIQILGI